MRFRSVFTRARRSFDKAHYSITLDNVSSCFHSSRLLLLLEITLKISLTYRNARAKGDCTGAAPGGSPIAFWGFSPMAAVQRMQFRLQSKQSPKRLKCTPAHAVVHRQRLRAWRFRITIDAVPAARASSQVSDDPLA